MKKYAVLLAGISLMFATFTAGIVTDFAMLAACVFLFAAVVIGDWEKEKDE